MDTTQPSLYFILTFAFVIIGIIIAAFIIAAMVQQRYVNQLLKVRDQSDIIMLENERKRMAADIHDELGPLLSAAKLKYSEAEVFCTEDEKLINHGNRMMDEIVTRIRNIAHDLIPTALANGPAFALNEFIDHLAVNNKLNIAFRPGTLPVLSEFQSLHIFRMLQEIINNTLKHADAHHLKIEMFMANNKMIISTIDDGNGFNYKTMRKKGKGLGLANLMSRAALLNGDVQVKSKIGGGTRYCIAISL